MAIKPARALSRRRLGLQRLRTTHRFIPDGDLEFANLARVFAEEIASDPGRFHLSDEDAQRIGQAVTEFRDALAKTRHRFSRSEQTTQLKDEARAKAEAIVRKYGNLIRLNDQINAADKIVVGIRERSKPVRRTRNDLPAPTLRFAGTTGEGTLLGHKHILRFYDGSDNVRRSRPQGAVRLELFVELVAPDEPMPQGPGQLSGGRGWYLRSYTRSPIHVEFPVARQQPMRVVYWARWADAKGNVGPFCATVKARVEGWDGGGRALPSFTEGRQRQQRIVITSAMKELPDYRPAEQDEASVEENRMLPEATIA